RWLEGVSGWPSQLLRVLSLMIALVLMDHAWFGTLDSAEALNLKFGFRRHNPLEGEVDIPLWSRLCRSTIFFWRIPRSTQVDFAPLWAAYRLRMNNWARAGRVVFWSLVTMLLLFLMFNSFGDGYHYEVPVRGLQHRLLMSGTMFFESIVFILLI